MCTLFNNRKSRKNKKTGISDALKACRRLKQKEDKNNSTLARFIRNLESRVCAKLSQQLVDNLFGETWLNAGTVELEGNKIDFILAIDTTITLTITRF